MFFLVIEGKVSSAYGRKESEFPHLQTLEEFVAFFEEHDLSPYLDQMEEVEFEIDLKGETRSSQHGTCAKIGQDR